MYLVEVFVVPLKSPDDLSGLKALISEKTINPQDIVALIGKTPGNGLVNDHSRGFATLAFTSYLAEVMGTSKELVQKKIAIVMSGGCEGVISPHLTIFSKKLSNSIPIENEKRLDVRVGHTKAFKPEEIGRMAQVLEVSRVVCELIQSPPAMAIADIHFVQIKNPLLTSEKVRDARIRGQSVATSDSLKSMGLSRAAAALGVACAMKEISVENLTDSDIGSNWNLFSSVASTSAGIELENCEIVVMGNSTGSVSNCVIQHAVMADSLDVKAVKMALQDAGIECIDGEVKESDKKRIINVFAKAEASPNGMVRGHPHGMLDDSDVSSTRHARAVVGSVIACVVGNGVNYVSGGAEHQGPAGGGPVAVIARVKA